MFSWLGSPTNQDEGPLQGLRKLGCAAFRLCPERSMGGEKGRGRSGDLRLNFNQYAGWWNNSYRSRVERFPSPKPWVQTDTVARARSVQGILQRKGRGYW